MPEGDKTRMGGTMRLGSRVTILRPGSRAFSLYGGTEESELEVRTIHETAISSFVSLLRPALPRTASEDRWSLP